MNDSYAGDLSPQEAWDFLRSNSGATIVDVRTLPEYGYVGRPDLSSLGRTLPLVCWQIFPDMRRNEDFVTQVGALNLSRDEPLLFLCRSGVRSRHAAIAMTAAGYHNCYNIAEGFEGDRDEEGHRGRTGGWKVAGLPWHQD